MKQKNKERRKEKQKEGGLPEQEEKNARLQLLVYQQHNCYKPVRQHMKTTACRGFMCRIC